MQRVFTLMLLLFLSAPGILAQNREAAFQMNARLGRGINMGNCFEAPSETAWGNPWKPEYFRIMSQLGLKHVRIPIRWEPADRSSATAPYVISPVFLKRIQQVVDTALKYKLHAIINMHHHEALIADPDGNKARFIAQWNQIATYFKSYPDSLLFEVLNEPNGNLTTAKWNVFFKDALAEIRKTNPARTVVMGVSEWGGLSALPNLQFPADENIILTIHYYNPFQFTHQGAEWSEGSTAWLGTKWNDTEPERETVKNEFKNAIALSKSQHIPIHIGEFGAYSKADINSRVRWTTFLSRWFEEQGFSWAYWEFSAGFGIYNPTTKVYLTPLVDALLHNPMPQPTPIQATPVYTSNFTSGNDGWSLNVQSGGAGTLSRSNGSLIANVTSGGTEAWHVQLLKYNIPLEKGKTYRISFKAKSVPARSSSVYTGMNASPWSSYSGYGSMFFTDTVSTYSMTFNMTAESDPKARLVIDMGKSASVLTITDVRVESISILSSSQNIEQNGMRIYPNPVRDWLTIDNNAGMTSANVIDLTGKIYKDEVLVPGVNTLQCGNIPPGIYLLRLRNNQQMHTQKLMVID